MSQVGHADQESTPFRGSDRIKEINMADVIETDVLVIGGGAAGTKAALKDADRGAQVTMVVKGLIGKSGCSIFASTIPFGTPTPQWLYYDEVDEEERAHYRLEFMVRYYNHYLADQEYCRRMENYMRDEFFGDLERLGVYWTRDDEGYVQPTAIRRTPLPRYSSAASLRH